jgi:hypothetical protein
MASIDTLYGGIDLPMMKLVAGMYVVGIVEVEKKEGDQGKYNENQMCNNKRF